MRRALMIVVTLTGLAACATPQERVASTEDRLSAAGFVVRPANSPERVSMLNRLPPHKFVRTTRGDRVNYVYADPLVCGCLYMGAQDAYNRYRANQLRERIANEQQMAAADYADASWNWGPWGWDGGFGPGWGPGFGSGW